MPALNTGVRVAPTAREVIATVVPDAVTRGRMRPSRAVGCFQIGEQKGAVGRNALMLLVRCDTVGPECRCRMVEQNCALRAVGSRIAL